MRTINVDVREAKIHLSKLLKRVTQGQEVVITDRGKPVGRIVSVPQDHLSVDERIKKMEEQGLIGPVRKGKAVRLPPPLPARKGVAQKFLQEDRDASVEPYGRAFEELAPPGSWPLASFGR